MSSRVVSLSQTVQPAMPRSAAAAALISSAARAVTCQVVCVTVSVYVREMCACAYAHVSRCLTLL